MTGGSDRNGAPLHLRDYWNDRATRCQDDCARIESGRRAQRMRFEAFLLAHSLDGCSVLDVGCGVGDFFDHLRRRGIRCDYHGIDLSADMVARASQKFPDGSFAAHSLIEWDPARTYDYTVAFAIHNVRTPGGRDLLERTLRRQFDLCTRAAHLSMLTDRHEGFAPHIQPWRAESMLALALSMTPHVALRHDYLPHDFSVTLYRRPLIDTQAGLLLDE